MRVVQLTSYAAPYPGSFVPMMAATVRACQARGWRAETVLPAEAADRGWPEELAIDGAPVHFVEAGPFRRRRALRTLLSEGGPTVLHSSFTGFDRPAVDLARGRADTRVIWHLHSRLGSGARTRLVNPVKWRAWGRRVDRVLCVAPNIRDSALEAGAPPDRTLLWTNAIDLDRFVPPGASERARAREQLGLDPEATVITHFGWDWHRKGGDLFLEAMLRLRERVPDVAAVTVGGGPAADVLIADLGLEAVARSAEPVADVRVLHAAADLFVTCSREEGMPFSMAEALASGVPVVATDIPGQRLIGDGVAACRFTRESPEEIASAAAELLGRDSRQAAEDARSARLRMEEDLGIGPWAERTADLYAKVLEADATPA